MLTTYFPLSPRGYASSSCLLQATLRSTVQIVNRTGLALDLRVLCSAWPVDPYNDLDISSGAWVQKTIHALHACNDQVASPIGFNLGGGAVIA